MNKTTEIDFSVAEVPQGESLFDSKPRKEPLPVETLPIELLPVRHALLKTDGGSRGNPGISGIGFVLIVDEENGPETICDGGAYIGIATNNQAEYQALIWGLRNAIHADIRTLDIHADSELIVKQLLGEYKVKNEGIKPLFSEAQALLQSFERCALTHVLREHNSAADTLANKAMDLRTSIGTFCVPFASGELHLGIDKGAQNKSAEQSSEQTSPHDQSHEQAPEGTQFEAAMVSTQQKKKGSHMYTLTIKDHFDAAHALVGYPGECRELHGHTWDVEVSVRGTQLDEVGIVYDFKDLKADLKAILDSYDHKYLNEIPPFDTINATAENLARVVYEQLEETLPTHIELVEVAVWESPIARLGYTRG